MHCDSRTYREVHTGNPVSGHGDKECSASTANPRPRGK